MNVSMFSIIDTSISPSSLKHYEYELVVKEQTMIL